MNSNISEDKYSHVQRCINCGLSVRAARSKPFQLLPLKCQKILKHWIGYDLSILKQSLEDNASSGSTSNSVPTFEKLCIECFKILEEYSDNTEKEFPERILGHAKVCAGCGMSLFRKRQIEIEELPYVNKYWPWYTKAENKTCCSKCSQRLKRIIEKEKQVTQKNKSNDTINNLETLPEFLISCKQLKKTFLNPDRNKAPRFVPKLNQIILADGKRFPSTKRCCFIKKCMNSNVHPRRIPNCKRRLVATSYDILIPENARVCEPHLINGFETVLENNNFITAFSVPQQFETFVDYIKQGMVVIDFENVEAMPNHICKYWTGVDVYRFIEMYEELDRPKIMKSALAAYLIRKITGDNVQKLAKLFGINSFTLKKQVKVVETWFSQVTKKNKQK